MPATRGSGAVEDERLDAVVLTGGDPVEPALAALLPPGALVVAADSGLHLAGSLGLVVDLVVGDFDSVAPDVLDAAVAHGARVERHPTAKDHTDLELALGAAVREGARRVVVVGGAGGRLDHFLANAFLLASPALAGVAIEAYIGPAHLHVVHGGQPPVELHGRSGSLVTLLPGCGTARGVCTDGLLFALHGEDLAAGTTRGVSNVMVDPIATVGLADGTLLVVQPDGGSGALT